MDPLTQGTLGASLAQASSRRPQLLLATFCGLLAGLAPDLDVLIHSEEDPLLFLEYHRQFTHSLIFIPVGALLVALPLMVLLRRRDVRFRDIYRYCLLGYATHALLDACTTYGTLLFWPFSDERIAWNSVSIIDPLLTGPLLLGVVIAARRRQALVARVAFAWVIVYLTLGFAARDAARIQGEELAVRRGHTPLTLEAKPSFANILLWKTVYRTVDGYYVDAIRLGWPPRVYEGTYIPALDLARDFPWLNPQSTQAKDVERFRWFSRGYLAADPEHPRRIMDLRYSLLPNEIRPLWSIELDPEDPSHHVRYLTHRERGPDTFSRLLIMLRGDDLPPTTRRPSKS